MNFMILPVFVYGSPVLRKKATQIDKTYQGLDTLIANMYETMYQSDGIGLAAPQIGKSIRLFIIDASELAEDHPELQGFKKTFINPVIIKEEGEEWAYTEGCLSVPNLREDVLRKSVVHVEYLDENFTQHTEVFDGIKARIFQHEYDHLEGTLFIDKLNPLKRKLLQGKLNAISRGKVKDVAYKIKFPG